MHERQQKLWDDGIPVTRETWAKLAEEMVRRSTSAWISTRTMSNWQRFYDAGWLPSERPVEDEEGFHPDDPRIERRVQLNPRSARPWNITDVIPYREIHVNAENNREVRFDPELCRWFYAQDDAGNERRL